MWACDTEKVILLLLPQSQLFLLAFYNETKYIQTIRCKDTKYIQTIGCNEDAHQKLANNFHAPFSCALILS